jgi:predicted metal-dependent hydrolase
MYTLHRRRGMKSIRLAVKESGEVWVSAPKWVPKRVIDVFVASKRDWIEKSIAGIETDGSRFALKGSKAEYAEYKEAARALVLDRLRHFAPLVGVAFNRVSIRNTARRWGSCSGKKNLNFHYKIIFLPPQLANYLIVHELSHLKEMNHSAQFWNLVRSIIPSADGDVLQLRAWKGVQTITI